VLFWVILALKLEQLWMLCAFDQIWCSQNKCQPFKPLHRHFWKKGFFKKEKWKAPYNYPSRVKRGGSLKFCIVMSHFCMSPHSPPTSVKLEAWKLACIILTRMAQKLLPRFLIFCLEAEILKFKVSYLHL